MEEPETNAPLENEQVAEAAPKKKRVVRRKKTAAKSTEKTPRQAAAAESETTGEPAPDKAPSADADKPPPPAEKDDEIPTSYSASPDDEAPAEPPPAGETAPAAAQNNSDTADAAASGQQQQQPKYDPNEPWWKRKKREKKEGKWRKQHGGNGGNGNNHQKNPQQPPPPKLETTPIGNLPPASRFADIAALDALAEELGHGAGEPLVLSKLYALTLRELNELAQKYELKFEGVPGRRQLVAAILKHVGEAKIPLFDEGWLDLTDKGHGFIVHEHVNYRYYPENSYVPESLVKRYGLKRGHRIEAILQAPQEGECCPALVGIKSVMGMPPGDVAAIKAFEELEPYYPLQRILLEAGEIHGKDISMRAIDLLTPVGFGQRGLIVAPPRTGKTVLLQNIANSIAHNFPEKKLIMLLIDERPEEVTDFKRHTKGEIVSSTFDESPANHIHAAEMVIEKARRLVEMGEHVVILLDSITRLARAYNALASNSGKIMSGGLEATALQKPKRFFGSARNIEGAGSLTILGTALIDTGSRMDEIIFEEFKGTGNMELHLDRGLSDKRIFPAINIDRSGTRKEELIYHPDEMLRVHGLRRAMQGVPAVEAMDMLIQRLKKTNTNAEFLMALNR